MSIVSCLSTVFLATALATQASSQPQLAASLRQATASTSFHTAPLPLAVANARTQTNSLQEQNFLDAVVSGDLARVEAALASGANVNAGDRTSGSTLTLAAERGDVEMVRLLVSRGAAVDAIAGSGQTALVKAVEAGNT